MGKYLLSVLLHPSCCDSNYLQRRLLGSSVIMHGRKYHWERGRSDLYYYLYCNNKRIGGIQVGYVCIYSEERLYCPNESFLKALLAMFNLYPY